MNQENQNNNVNNEQELWDVLSGDVKEAPKAVPAKKGPKFAANDAPKGRVDGFFLSCMAGVAAVSVAATLVIGGMVGGDKTPSGDKIYSGAEVPTGESMVTILEQQAEALKLENAELRAQLEQQKKQVKDLQTSLLEIMGSEEYLATVPSDSEENNEHLNAQVEAYQIYTQIQEAYADFDREKLEQLIPEMDKRLAYLSNDALMNYYLILEYMEQPSNG